MRGCFDSLIIANLTVKIKHFVNFLTIFLYLKSLPSIITPSQSEAPSLLIRIL